MPNETWEPDHFFFSAEPYGTFFDAAEQIGQAWTLSRTKRDGQPPQNPEEAQMLFEKLLTDLIALSTLLHNFAVDSATAIMSEHFFGGNPPVEDLGTIKAPAVYSIKIPTWTYIPD